MSEYAPASQTTLVPAGHDVALAYSRILDRLHWGRQFWKPLHDRMDYWLTMYLLLDPIQQMKPMNYRRFVSNDPRTAIDAAINISVRNDPFWRIDMPYGMDREEREKVGKVERGLSGVVDDLDSMFRERGEPPFWRQVAWFAYMRGAIWGKFHVTKMALEMGRSSPLLGEFWDPRWVYPNYDGIGLESVTVEKQTTLGELLNQYGPQVLASLDGRQLNLANTNPNAPAVKVEYWSNKRPDGAGGWVPGITAVLGYYSTDTNVGMDPTNVDAASACWLIPPYAHGYEPDALPVVGTFVNGLNLKTKPMYGANLIAAMSTRAQRFGQVPPTWHDPSGWVAERGRGFLSSIEELNAQYNELIATVFQHFTISTYPTWVFNTQSGQLPEFADGINAHVPLRIGETVQRLEPSPVNQDAYRLVEILKDEKQKGTINSILQANGGMNAQSGIILQQNLNAALNNLDPYQKDMAGWGTDFGSHTLGQLRVSGIDTLSLVARGPRSYIRIEFDPKVDLGERKYKPVPIFRPSVPEDMLLKAQVARLLLDPRAPIMSVVTVLDKIFQLEDPEGEGRRMDEDIASRDPVILLERVATILEEEGEPEMAARIRQREFQASFADQVKEKDMQFQMAQLTAQIQQLASATGQTPGPAGGAEDPMAALNAGAPGSGGGAEGLGLSASSGAPSATVHPGTGQGGAPMPGGL